MKQHGYSMLGLVLWFIGGLGLVMGDKSVLLLVLCIELMLLRATVVLVDVAYSLSDVGRYWFGFLTTIVARAETAIGLGIIVAVYRTRGGISHMRW